MLPKILTLLSILLVATAQAAEPAGSEGDPVLARFDAAVLDRDRDPCTNFYEHVCSKWTAANPIPPDQARWGTSSSLILWNDAALRQTLERAAAGGAERSAAERLAGDYWQACMNEAAVENQGLRPLAKDLERVEALRAKSGLAAEVARLHLAVPGAWLGGNSQTPAVLLGFGPTQDFVDSSLVVAAVDQGGMGLPGRDFYLSDNPKMKAIRERYRSHVKKMFELAGRKAARAERDMEAVLRIETALAKGAMDAVARRDPKNIYHPMSLAQLRALTPSFDWATYLRLLGAPASKHYVITSPDFLRALEQLIRGQPLESWKAYLSWWTLHGNAPYLGPAIAEEHFDLYGRALTGAPQQRPRWRRCVKFADRDIGDALGQAYVARAFPPSDKSRVEAIVKGVEAALGRTIAQLDWMGGETKTRAADKLAAIENKIGYPASWRDYGSLRIDRGDLVGNVHQATALEMKHQLAKVGKPVDRIEWQMTPPTVNAYYDPQLNTINFPAGILHPPFFDAGQDEAVNYGAIGMVAGHEIIHGFDDEGRKFDGAGNLKDWWTAEDGKTYEKRVQCIADQYTADIPDLGVKQDGRLTLGEDTSDNGGVRLALLALEEALRRRGQTLETVGADGLTAGQRFFDAYAFTWCTTWRPEESRTHVATDPHSLPRLRVNNVVANVPEFRKAFGCSAGKPMVRENACRVW